LCGVKDGGWCGRLLCVTGRIVFHCFSFESVTNPRVVLVINNNIHAIELMPTQVKISGSSITGMARTSECGPSQNAQDMDWQKLKTPHFWLSDPRSY
jgi:hypothetical protein